MEEHFSKANYFGFISKVSIKRTVINLLYKNLNKLGPYTIHFIMNNKSNNKNIKQFKQNTRMSYVFLLIDDLMFDALFLRLPINC